MSINQIKKRNSFNLMVMALIVHLNSEVTLKEI